MKMTTQDDDAGAVGGDDLCFFRSSDLRKSSNAISSGSFWRVDGFDCEFESDEDPGDDFFDFGANHLLYAAARFSSI